ncbi:MAG: bifunctional pyr operon transcriptional regulator/uracil phosphoribosyltransferase PyrR [Oscillospiraceae bacterium]|nr:bifunctional pyr operon transcriptional regulator/uracil phosphoribosyltransferase PyrR [Oscillospiraceae bacterium]
MYVQKAVLLDAGAMERSLMRISHEIVERNAPCEGLCVVGVYRRGAVLAEKIARNVEKITGKAPLLGALDISLYRDDLSELGEQPSVAAGSLGFEVRGKTVVLVDDVLYTGRTARAAIEAVIRRGRPAAIQLAVLIDRGHRELPIRADYTGKNVPTSRRELIEVRVEKYDGVQEVALLEKREEQR